MQFANFRDMNRFKIILYFLILSVKMASAQGQSFQFDFKGFFPVQNFDLTGTAGNDSNLWVKTMKTDGALDDKMEGSYRFIINGFYTDLNFQKGFAPITYTTETGNWIYIKYEGKTETLRKLFYLMRFNGTISVFTFPLWLLLVIPLLIIIITLMMRRLIIILLLLVFVGLIYWSGIDFHSMYQLMIDALKNIFS